MQKITSLAHLGARSSAVCLPLAHIAFSTMLIISLTAKVSY